MSKRNLDALRSRFKSLKDGKKEYKNSEIYPFWDMKIDERAVVRILNDLNEENPNQFFIDKLEHSLPVNGKVKKIPCITMYGSKCPICDLSQKFYKAGDKVQGKLYWRNKQSLLRALVIKDPLPAGEDGENAVGKVKTMQFGYQLMQKIIEQISNEDEPMEGDPCDLEDGYNFTIKKVRQGDHDNYSIGSTFSNRTSAVPEEFMDAAVLVDLRTLLPKDPGEDAVHAFLNAHLTGEDIEEESATPPAGVRRPAPAARPAPAVDADEDEEEEDAPPPRRPTTRVVREEVEEEEDAPPPRRPTTRAAREEVEEEEEETPPPRRSSRAARVEEEEADGEETTASVLSKIRNKNK